MSDGDRTIDTASGVNLEGKPFCHVRWGNMEGQFSPAELRQFALTCLATAEAAEHDAAFFAWTMDGPLQVERDKAAAIMGAQRAYRDELEGRFE